MCISAVTECAICVHTCYCTRAYLHVCMRCTHALTKFSWKLHIFHRKCNRCFWISLCSFCFWLINRWCFENGSSSKMICGLWSDSIHWLNDSHFSPYCLMTVVSYTHVHRWQLLSPIDMLSCETFLSTGNRHARASASVTATEMVFI